MADKSITALRELAANGVRATDPLPLVSLGASETMKVSVKSLMEGGLPFIADGSIPGVKVDFDLPDDAVDTDQIKDGAITAPKLADNSSTIVGIGVPNGTGSSVASFYGQHYLDSATGKLYTYNGASWVAVQAAGSVNTITGYLSSAYPEITTTATKTGDSVEVKALLQDTTGARQFLAGPTNGPGAVSSRVIVGLDLPTASPTEKGAVTVNGNGLKLTGDRVEIDNSVSPNSNRSLVTFNAQGLVLSGSPLVGSDLPPANSSEIGGVRPGEGLEVDVNGTIGHPTNVTPGTYTKVSVSSTGHVEAGVPLEASDIPNLSYDKITSGQVQPGSLAEDCVTGPTIADYATAFMQEGSPGQGDFLGQLWLEPSTSQLRMYARGSNGLQWINVGFGALQANNLRWGGSYDADTNTLTVLTAIGTGEGLKAGEAFPQATNALSGMYFICQTAGNNMTQPALDGINHTAGDWALCVDETQGWLHIDAAAGSGGGSGGGASYLNDLLDVELAGTAADDLLKYDGSSGLWKNNHIIDGGSID